MKYELGSIVRINNSVFPTELRGKLCKITGGVTYNNREWYNLIFIDDSGTCSASEDCFEACALYHFLEAICMK